MNDLISFASKHDASFASKIEGLSEAEINLMEHLSQRKFPAVYRAFLRLMGKNMGGMGYININFTVDALHYYHENRDLFNWPDYILLVGEYEQDPYCHYFLDLRTLKEEDCQVFSFDYELTKDTLQDTHMHFRAPGFRTLLFELAFLCKYMGRFSYYEYAMFDYNRLKKSNTAADTVTLVEQTAVALGFTKLDQARPTHLMLDRADAAIYVKCAESGSVGFTVASDSQEKALAIKNKLSNENA